MKLSAKSDLEAPVAFVYAALVDHASWEREARARGIDIERPADMPYEGVGAGWRARVPFRGKVRNILVRIDAMTPDQRLVLGLEGQSLLGYAVVEVLALSPRRTRLRLVVELGPKTLAARLFLNTLRLAKGRVQSRLELRLSQLGTRIEERYARTRAMA